MENSSYHQHADIPSWYFMFKSIIRKVSLRPPFKKWPLGCSWPGAVPALPRHHIDWNRSLGCLRYLHPVKPHLFPQTTSGAHSNIHQDVCSPQYFGQFNVVSRESYAPTLNCRWPEMFFKKKCFTSVKGLSHYDCLFFYSWGFAVHFTLFTAWLCLICSRWFKMDDWEEEVIYSSVYYTFLCR